MKLTDVQLDFYRRKGYLLIEGFFSTSEMDLAKNELSKEKRVDSPCRILEKTGQVRSVFGLCESNPIFDVLSRLDCLITPTKQLLDDEIYIHQSKANTKSAFLGDWWEWHQDFTYWHLEDGMPSPNALTVAIYLDEVNEFNGPLLIVPGSHNVNGASIDVYREKEGEPAYMSTLTADLKYKVNESLLEELIEKEGIISTKGARGSVLFFHGNVFHASTNNISPWSRDIFMISYNSISNQLGSLEHPRPEFLANRNFKSITPINGKLSQYLEHITK